MEKRWGVSVFPVHSDPTHKATPPSPSPSLRLTAHGDAAAAAAAVSVPSTLPAHLPKATNPTNTTAEDAIPPPHSQPSVQLKAPSVLVCFKIDQASASPSTVR